MLQCSEYEFSDTSERAHIIGIKLLNFSPSYPGGATGRGAGSTHSTTEAMVSMVPFSTHYFKKSSLFIKSRVSKIREMGIAIYNPMNLKVLNILKPSFLSFSLCACLFKKICNTEC